MGKLWLLEYFNLYFSKYKCDENLAAVLCRGLDTTKLQIKAILSHKSQGWLLISYHGNFELAM